jgi:hypothetical protein
MQEVEEIRGELEALLVDEESIRNFDVSDYLYGSPYDLLSEIFASADDSGWLYYESADGAEYLYFRPCYPWQADEYCPKSATEVHKRIIAAVSKFTDMSAEEIEAFIDDDLFDFYYA